tara:strand:- start:31919 stop:32161 length:243 start_codon:yes stop_codon:yes gene_type:complete
MVYAALAGPLRRYGLPLVIISVIPFGIVGAILGHVIVGSAVSMLSAIGLSGIVVNGKWSLRSPPPPNNTRQSPHLLDWLW